MQVASAYIAIHLPADRLEQSIAFYESVFGQPCSLRFVYSAHEVEIAAVGPVVIIAGSADALARNIQQAAALGIDSLSACLDTLIENGAEILQQPGETPTGRNLFARHPDGTVIEYIEFDEARAAAVNQAPGARADGAAGR